MLLFSWSAVWTAVVVLAMIVVLVREWVRPDLTLLGSLCLLLLGGVVTPDEALRGFASPALFTIASLYVVAAAVHRTGALSGMDLLLFASQGSLSWRTFRFASVTAGASAVLNNTPIVAILIPRVQRWAEREGIAPSKVLIPLSYAAVLGGMITLIGTSTNLVVSGLLRESTGRGFSMFDLTWVGLPAAIAGIAYVSLICHRLLPLRGSVVDERAARTPYHFELRVPLGRDLPLRTVHDGLILGPFRVRRASGDIVIPTDDTVLHGGDVIAFAGDHQSVQTLRDQFGLMSVLHADQIDDERADDTESASAGSSEVFEAVVSGTSALLGRSLGEADLAERFQAHVIGIQRRDADVEGPLEEVVLRAGDLLLVEAPSHFYDRWTANREEFYFVAPTTPTEAEPIRRDRARWVLAIFLIMVGGASLGGVPLVTMTLAAALAILLVGALRPTEAQRSIDFPVLLMIGASFGISAALETSGLAAALAKGMVAVTQDLGPIGAIVILYLVTTLMTELLTNSAAAALAVPVALEIAASTGTDPLPYAIAVAISASAGFATPFGYQTNLMVMGAGGYRFADYVRAGLPLNGLVMVVAITAIWLLWL